MNSRIQPQTWRWLAATLLVLSLVLSSLGVAISIKAQGVEGAPLDNAPQQTESLDDLPLGLAPAIAQTLAEGLPDSFHLQAVEDGYRTDNPAHDLTTTFTPAGPQMTISGETWGLTLTGVGRDGTVQALPATELVVDGPRLEYRRDNLTEWYLNTHWGLEQGFTLQTPPAGSGNLTLELNTSGSLQASLQDDTTLLLTNAAGQLIAHYTALHAYDANGRTLPAHLELETRHSNTCPSALRHPLQRTADAGQVSRDRRGGRCQGLTIVVDDASASYPLTIDPWLQRAKLTASDREAYDSFGYSVAVSGDTAVVGAFWDDNGRGSAYVYVRPDTGWTSITETAKLTASDGAEGDRFGSSVAVSGDTVVVGAFRDDSDRGSAYVYVRPDAGWVSITETAKLTASDGEAYDYFGYSVAVSGDTAVAGAYQDDNWRGSAYVYVRPDTGWASITETAKLTASDGADYDYLGYSVAASRDTVVVGAFGDDSGRGSAYVYVRPDTGWVSITETAKLAASDGVAGDYFGDPVAVSGDTAVVGAWRDDSGRGSAYVYVRPDTGWASITETAKLTSSDGVADDYFGWSVAVSGDTAVVGAYHDDTERGSAYVYVRPDAGWANTTETTKLTASDGAYGDRFGWSLAVSGDTTVVGAYYDDTARGSAYVFLSFADLAIAKTVTPVTATPGQAITYTLTFSNTGTGAATGVVITDTIPFSVTNTSVISSGVAITQHPSTRYVWDVADLAPGAGGIITIAGVLSEPLAAGVLINTTTITSTDLDSTPTNNTATATTTVQIPVAGLLAANDSPTALGQPTYLTATVAVGGPVSFTWDLGDGSGGSGALVAHTYPAVGAYTAVVTAFNAVSWQTATTEVIVEEPLASLVAVNDSPTILGQPTTLTATVTAGANVIYTWALGDGDTASGAQITHTYAATGTYTAVVTASNAVSLLTATTLITVVEGCIPPHGADFDWTPLTPTVGAEVTFNGTAGGTAPLTYTWNLGDGNLGSGPNPIHAYEMTGDYTVTMTVTNACGEESVFHVITISQEPCVEIETVELTLLTAGTLYTDTLVEFSADIGPDGFDVPYTYTVDHGDGSAPVVGTSGDDPYAFNYTYTNTGTYTIEFAAWNCDMAEPVTDSITFTVYESGVCVELESIDILGEASGYPGVYTFTITYLPSDASLPIAYLWDDGGTDASSTRNLEVGDYALIVTATNCVDVVVVDTHVITISQAPAVPLDLSAWPTTLYANNLDTAALTITGTAGSVVTLSHSLPNSNISPGVLTLDGNGHASATYTAGFIPRQSAPVSDTIQATDGISSVWVTVQLLPNPLAGVLSSEARSRLVTYTFVISNTDDDVQSNVVVTGHVPAGWQLIAVTGGISVTSGGKYGTGYAYQVIPTMAPGSQHTLIWVAREQAFFSGGILTVAEASSETARLFMSVENRIYRVLLPLISHNHSFRSPESCVCNFRSRRR